MMRVECRSKVKLSALGMITEYTLVSARVGRAIYRHTNSPVTPTGYNTMNKVYLVTYK